jgi:hypothetical protein
MASSFELGDEQPSQEELERKNRRRSKPSGNAWQMSIFASEVLVSRGKTRRNFEQLVKRVKRGFLENALLTP